MLLIILLKLGTLPTLKKNNSFGSINLIDFFNININLLELDCLVIFFLFRKFENYYFLF